GTGEASGEDRAVQAAEKAIANPLLDEISLKGAKGVLINITGGHDLTLFELDEAANRIREEVDPDANIIVGSTLDEAMNGVMRVSVVATGIDAIQAEVDIPTPRRRMAEPLAPAATVAAQPVEPRAAAPVTPAVEPQREAQPAFASTRAEPAPQPAAAPVSERTLFDAPQDSDDLPAPAYRPQPAAAENLHVEAEAAQYVAPRPRAPGTPSPEALARLQAAVNRAPGQAARTMQGQPAQRPQANAPMQRLPEKPRFGINSLLNRMTGHGAEPVERVAPAIRQKPQVQAHYDDDASADPEHERVEIPAFLRRQAN
ncbi:MAG: cell division protein FtsZ, partial [Rhodobacteraceae bacterium]|nr:cell division protein FtsZ [Paracoccaceae bacterium]